MENQNSPSQDVFSTYQNTNNQMPLPNSTAILVLGILSIVSCVCYGIPGLAMGIIALAMSPKANTLYQDNPRKYTLSSFNNMKAGKICAIIGIVLSALMFLYLIIVLMFVGAAFSVMPWGALMNQ